MKLGKCANLCGCSNGFGGQMIDGYDKSLHAPWLYTTMESPAQELDEVALDAAIADLIKEENPAQSQEVSESRHRPEFPELLPQESTAAHAQDSGVGSVLRQKWAQLSGAA